ncbi:MAG: helix-turn-helix domain-containing protein [Pseudomonadota bacterium]
MKYILKNSSPHKSDKSPTTDGLSQAVNEHLQTYFQAHNGHLPPPGLYKRFIQEVERPLLELSLKAVGGSQVKAAEILGITRNTLRKKLQVLNGKQTKS